MPSSKRRRLPKFKVGDKVVSKRTKARGRVILTRPFAVLYNYKGKKHAKVTSRRFWEKIK